MTLHYDYFTAWGDHRAVVENHTTALKKAFTQNNVVHHVGLRSLSLIALRHDKELDLVPTLLAMHNLQGQQTFVVGERLGSMLEHTSLRDISKEELQLPYPTFYVSLQGCQHVVRGKHPIRGFYVQHDQKADALVLLIWGKSADGQASDMLELDFIDNEDLETSLQNLEPEDDDALSHHDKIGLVAMVRIAVNLSLYLVSQDPETEAMPEDARTKALRGKLTRAKTPGKRKKIERQLDRCSKATVIRVGDSIEARIGEQVAEHGSMSAHWVRGHWHHYWTGTGRTVKVRRWVLPYPKGLEPPTKRSYKVEDAEQDEPESTP